MQLRIAVCAAWLAGYASAHPAVVECKKYLPKDHYAVIDVVKVKAKGVLQIYASKNNPEAPTFIKNYDVRWPKLAHWGKPKKNYLVLLQRGNDKLVMCEVEIPGCSPEITWLSGFPQDDPNKLWQVDKREGGICALASPHNTSLERTRDR
jgi:hypothetical protein